VKKEKESPKEIVCYDVWYDFIICVYGKPGMTNPTCLAGEYQKVFSKNLAGVTNSGPDDSAGPQVCSTSLQMDALSGSFLTLSPILSLFHGSLSCTLLSAYITDSPYSLKDPI
jgi:hypothetical protein